MRFEGKIAVVTGGSSGIGRDVALRLATEGAAVVIGGRDAAKLEHVAAEIARVAGATGRVSALAGDIADPAVGRALIEAAERRHGGLDLLVSNAGIFEPAPFLEVEEAAYDRFLDIILKGKFFVAQAAALAMRRHGRGGAIVHTGSLWAMQAIGATPSAAYSAANAGVHALTRNLAIELAADRIRVNAVAPAVVETPIYARFLGEDGARATLPSFDAFHPLGRNGQPGDVGEAILFLASDAASWITGVVLPVDGGVMAGRR